MFGLICAPSSIFSYVVCSFTSLQIVTHPLLLSAISWSYQSISPPSLFNVQSVFIHLSSSDRAACQWVASGVKDGGVTGQRGSLVLYTCARSLGSWSWDCDVCVCGGGDKVMVGALSETVERTWQTTCGMGISPELLILARHCLAAVLSQSLSVSAQLGSTIHGDLPRCTAAFILFLSTSTF